MTTRSLAARIGTTLAALSLLAGAIQVQAARERAYPAPDMSAESEAVYVTSGSAIRRLSGAYSSLAADLYWIRVIQHYGGTKRRLAAQPQGLAPPAALSADATTAYGQLYPLLDITTTLDPRFNIAYRFGAVFLAESYPSGPGRPDLAIRLLEKGLRERPDKWEYMQDIGFVHYWYQQDYQVASEWFARAADVPGAPWWLRSLAATTLTQGGDRQSSLLMWEAIRESAEVDWLRTDAERRLGQLRAMDDIDALTAIVDRHAASSGQGATDWQTLVRAGALRGVPVDPSGTPYEIQEGRVRLSRSSPLFPLPDDPATNPLRPAS